ncbi:MAG: aldolase/citrate lyase family protein [Caldilineaceae bacterium]
MTNHPIIVIVPQVRQIVHDCRYPPLGTWGYGPRVPSNYGRDGGADYIARANRELFVAVQIETAEALAALDEILATPGLDSLVLGPWDLSGALGRLGEVEHPTMVAAIETVIAKSRAAGCFVGAGMGTDPAYAATMAQRGVQWLQVGCDYGYLVEGMEGLAAAIRARV